MNEAVIRVNWRHGEEVAVIKAWMNQMLRGHQDQLQGFDFFVAIF